MDNRKLSICIPTFNRDEMLFNSFKKVYDDERVNEIIIVDDASEPDIYESIRKKCFHLPKVKLYRNINNRGCYENKYTAVSFASNEFVILLDSDNNIDISYLDRIFEYEWNTDTIMTPSWAAPHFDFRKYEGLVLSKENIAQWIDKPMLETCLNAANYFVSRMGYLRTWDNETEPMTSDSIYMVYRWLAAGGKVHIVKDLHYYHLVHPGSHYQNNVHKTAPGFHQSILDKLKQLK